MRILEIRDAVAPIASPIRNAFIDFSRMTISVIAIVTDVERNGEPVIGYGFHSNGRYAQQGILRSRLIPRLLEADPDSLLDETGENFDPEAIWHAFMHNEKPGGHGDRAVAAGALDMAVWDVVAKVAEQPLWRLLSDRYNDGRHDDEIVVYPGGGYYYPGKEVAGLKDEMRRYDDAGYRVAKMKIGGADIATDQARIEGALEVLGEGQRLAVDANGKFDLQTAIDYARMLEPYDLFWYEEPGDPIDYALQAELAGHYDGAMATGENLFSTQDVCNLIRFRRHAARPRLDPGGSRAGLRPDRVSQPDRSNRAAWLAAAPVDAARRPSAGAEYRRGAADRRHRILSVGIPALWRVRRRYSDRRRARPVAGRARYRHGAQAGDVRSSATSTRIGRLSAPSRSIVEMGSAPGYFGQR